MSRKKGKIGFAIIGCGLFGERMLIPAFKKCEYAELIAITKRDGEAARNLADKHGIPYGFAYDDLESLLELEEIEAVFIATPNNMHLSDTIKAASFGKHILLEKPMAVNAEECEKMLNYVRQRGLKFMIAQNQRFNTTVNFIKDKIKSGEIGKIVTATCDFTSNGFASKRKWKFDRKMAGGGAAFDLGVHLIDTLKHILEEEIKEVKLFTVPPKIPDDKVDLVTSFLLYFGNGIPARATATFIGPRHTYLEIIGEKGYYRAFDWNMPETEVRIDYETMAGMGTIYIVNDDMYKNEIDAFASCIIWDEKEPIPAEIGLENQRIIDRIYKEE